MASCRYKIILPEFTATQASRDPSQGNLPVTLVVPGEPPLTYYPAPELREAGSPVDGKPIWAPLSYPVFPVVLCGDGSPWAEANVWLLCVLEFKTLPNMLTLGSLADDLAAYRRYIEEETIDWLNFPAHKTRRPTYRYHGSLNLAVQNGEVARSLAKRRMGTVIRFYRWMMDEAKFQPLHSPWVDRDRYVTWRNETGFSGSMVVKTTNISLRDPRAIDPYDDHINDGGRLRPLTQAEQRALIECLEGLGNTEMTLIHLVSLFTGARSQSVLTLRLRHVIRRPDLTTANEVRLQAGPGTGIDTKGSKRGVLHLPKWLYEHLHVYANSERAKRRRSLADRGDSDDQLLFLSHRGAPFYDIQAGRHKAMRSGRLLRHFKTGQGVRQFMLEKLLPALRTKLGRPDYTFKFHDLRATFGMNVVDSMGPSMDARELTYSQALDRLRQLLWHASPKTTERYLQYQVKRQALDSASDGWNAHLATLATRALVTNRHSNAPT